MKASNILDSDLLPRIAGLYKEVYVPAANQRITSTALGGKRLKFCKFMLSATATVTYRTLGGALVSAETTMPANTIFDFLVTEIHSISTGTCYIIHDGVLDTGFDQ